MKTACLDKDDLSASMELARELISAEIVGLLFPSVVGDDDNLVVYRVNCGRKALSLKNEREVLDQVRRIAGRHKKRVYAAITERDAPHTRFATFRKFGHHDRYAASSPNQFLL